MGYSCSRAAIRSLEAIAPMLQSRLGGAGGSSNAWGDCEGTMWFYELGRENADGAITGSVNRYRVGGRTVGGSFRIEADGVITRFPSATPNERALAGAIGTTTHAMFAAL